MMRPARTIGPARPGAEAFTLIEAVISIGVVGMMLVVALNTAGAARYGQYKMCQRGRGMLLAQELMAEILPQAYVEPVDTAKFGPETAEGAASRAGYDDVDDYHLWSASPPQAKDGTRLTDLTRWKRRVTVQYVWPDALGSTSATDQGIKRIEVEVTHNDIPMATLWAVRSDNVQQADDP